MDKLFGQLDNVAAGEQETAASKIEDAAIGEVTHMETSPRDSEKIGARDFIQEKEL